MKTIYKIQLIALVILGVTFASCKKDQFELIPKEDKNEFKDDQAALKAAFVKNATSFNLYAGQTISAGTVNLRVDGDNLKVTYNTTNGFEIVEAHLFVGESLSLMPQAQNGNPKIGNFPYASGTLAAGITSYTFSIPLSNLGSEPYICDRLFYVASHASVRRLKIDGTYQNETAWAGIDRLVQKGSWATYFSFSFGCQNDVIDPKSSETAFAFGQKTFVEYGLTNNRWGWVYTINQQGTFETPIYAGAGGNDITKGYLVGKAIFTYNGSTLNVKYQMLDGFVMTETQLYTSNIVPTTIAPGQYGNIHNGLQDVSSDEFNVSVSGGTIYIIAHTVVWSSLF